MKKHHTKQMAFVAVLLAYLYDTWFLPIQLYGTEYRRGKERTNSVGIPYRSEIVRAYGITVCYSVFHFQSSDDGVILRCGECRGYQRRNGIFENSIAVVFYDCN